MWVIGLEGFMKIWAHEECPWAHTFDKLAEAHMKEWAPSRLRKKPSGGIDNGVMELTFAGTMRGENTKQSSMLMLMSPETRVPAGHPLRGIKELADAALGELSPVFDEMYSSVGRPSIPPERLLKAMLLVALSTASSER